MAKRFPGRLFSGWPALLVLCCLLAGTLHAQRLMGYYPYYRTGLHQRLDFTKLTDITYAWLNADLLGNLQLSGTFRTEDFGQLIHTARQANPAIRLHVSSGGWGHSTWLTSVATNPLARQRFVTELADFLIRHDLDGWDLDWEFPSSVAKREAHETLVRAVREEFDRRQLRTGRRLEVSIAVGGGVGPHGHVRYYTPEVAHYVDAIIIMAYDDGTSENHSSMEFAMTALRGYRDKLGWPTSKMMLGVPFYGRKPRNGPARSFGRIASDNPFDAHSQNRYDNFCYNGPPLLEAKIDSTVGRYGGLGIAAWELGHDHPEADCSLISHLHWYLREFYARPGDGGHRQLAFLPFLPVMRPVLVRPNEEVWLAVKEEVRSGKGEGGRRKAQGGSGKSEAGSRKAGREAKRPAEGEPGGNVGRGK